MIVENCSICNSVTHSLPSTVDVPLTTIDRVVAELALPRVDFIKLDIENAEAAAIIFERSFAPNLTGGLSYHKSLLVGGSDYQGPFEGKTLDSIETPDDKTIVFKLDAPYGDWPWLASMPAFAPVPEGEGKDTGAYDAKPVSSGPYQIESNTQGSQVTLVRNKEWSAKTDSIRTAGPSKIVFKESRLVGVRLML